MEDIETILADFYFFFKFAANYKTPGTRNSVNIKCKKHEENYIKAHNDLFFFQTSDEEETLQAVRGEKQNVTQGHKKKQESRFLFKINASKKTSSMTLKYRKKKKSYRQIV